MPALPRLSLVVIAILLFIPSLGCFGSKAGGPCTYSEHAGTATITGVTPVETSPQGADAPPAEYWIEFKTELSDPQPTQSFYRNEGNRFKVKNPAGNTDEAWLASQGIAVDAKLDVKVSLITSGTCSPMIFKFPTLPAGAVKD
ncbi:MAG: hypothetical protein U1A77_19060 [Pirellulales bacterium]